VDPVQILQLYEMKWRHDLTKVAYNDGVPEHGGVGPKTINHGSSAPGLIKPWKYVLQLSKSTRFIPMRSSTAVRRGTVLQRSSKAFLHFCSLSGNRARSLSVRGMSKASCMAWKTSKQLMPSGRSTTTFQGKSRHTITMLVIFSAAAGLFMSFGEILRHVGRQDVIIPSGGSAMLKC
jgi:hypothetical protein